MSAQRKPSAKAPTPRGQLSPALEARLSKIEAAFAAAIEDVARLVCPYCGPAEIAKRHPEKVPQPLRPVALEPDLAEHDHPATG